MNVITPKLYENVTISLQPTDQANAENEVYTPTNEVPQSSPASIPTPTVPGFSWLTILPIILAIPIVLLIIRKTVSRNIPLRLKPA